MTLGQGQDTAGVSTRSRRPFAGQSGETGWTVDLVYLVGLVQPNNRDKPSNGLLTLAAFFRILVGAG
jgi:hypothetical protein